MKELCFKKLANGVWKASIGEDYPTLLGFSGTTPAVTDEGEELAFPFAADGVTANLVKDRHIVSIPFASGENLYGLGLSYQNLCKNYAVVPLRSDHYKSVDNGRTHVPTPFYVSTAGYGVLIDTTEFPTFYMAGHVRKDAKNPPQEKDRGTPGSGWKSVTPSEFVEVSFTGKGADIYVIAGDSMADVVSRFNLLCGGGCMVPKWGLGFWSRIHTHSKEENVYREVDMYREHGFPLDVIGLEPGWHSNSYPCTYDWSTERFPNPGKLASDLLEQGVRLNLWENLYVSRKSSIYNDMYPLSGSHMVWNGIVPDYTMQETRDIYAKHHKKYQLGIGISGFKIDECDGYDKYLWPDHAEFPSGNSAATLRQSYGLLAQRTIQEMYREMNTRTYGLVRASNAGASSFPFCIYNDCYSFKEFLNGISTAAFSGTLWVPEVRDAKSPEEWVRRFQLCSVSSMLMLNAWSSGVKPWKYPEVEDIIRDTVMFRKRLLPYLYNVFYTYHKTGLPPFRPLCMDFGGIQAEETGSGALDHTTNPYELKELRDITNQFMVGEYLMAAPVEPGMEEREVVLPAGYKWYDFFTGEYVGSGEKKIFSCPLDKMLLFVREGGMIPMIDADSIESKDSVKLAVRCFGDKGACTLYDDDGVSFDFEKGAYSLTELSFERVDGRVVGKANVVYDGYASAYDIRFE